MSKIVGKISAEMIIVLIVIIALITFLVYKNVTKPEPIVYYVAKASAQTENTLITTQFKLRKLLNEKKVEEQMQNKNTFDKENILDKYTEEYFDSKKLAVISCYEDEIGRAHV